MRELSHGVILYFYYTKYIYISAFYKVLRINGLLYYRQHQNLKGLMVVLRERIIHICPLHEIQADYFHGIKIKSRNMFELLRMVSSHRAAKGNGNLNRNFQDILASV